MRMACMGAAVQMAAGLGPDFNLHARGLTVVLLDKLKDTNRAVVEAVQTCLDTFLLVSRPCGPVPCCVFWSMHAHT
jgi:hypothetical protein